MKLKMDLTDETELRMCVVCAEPVEVAANFTGDVLCINDFFSDDPTEEWEA